MDECLYGYPKIPSLRTLISCVPPLENIEKKGEIIAKAKVIKNKVRKYIRDTEDADSHTMIELLTKSLGRVTENGQEDGLRVFAVADIEFMEDTLLRQEIAWSHYSPYFRILHGIHMYCLLLDTRYCAA